MNRLAQKRILLTGGTSGIGLATVRQALAQGAEVMVTGRRQEGLDRLVAETDGKVLTVRSDISDPQALPTLTDSVVHHWGGLDGVFLCAADVTHMPLEKWQEEDFDLVMNTNFKGPFFLLQALLPLLDESASVVLCGSVSAHIGFPDSSIYAASKAALLSLARTLSRELVGRKIRVNSVSPGPTLTPAVELLQSRNERFMDDIASIVPIGRLGDPEEIAGAVIFLLSEESSYMRGSEIVVDGGVIGL